MIKKAYLSLVIMAFTFSTNAQDSLQRIKAAGPGDFELQQKGDVRVALTFSTGTSWAKPQSNNVDRAGSALGYSISLFAEDYFGQNYAFIFGVSYTRMPVRVSLDSAVANNNGANNNEMFRNVKYSYVLSYLEFPLGIRLKSEPFGYNRISIDIGTAPGFLIAAKADVEPGIFGNLEDNQDRKVNGERKDFNSDRSGISEDNIRIYRIPIVLGANFEHQINRTNTLTVGLRYNIGLTDLARDKDISFQNNMLGLNVGILF